MDDQVIITKQIKSLIGAELIEPSTVEIEKGTIQKFAEAIGDKNPLWQDVEYAEKTRYGGIVAPPTFLTFTAFWPDEIQHRLAMLDSPLKRIMAGGVEYNYFQAVKPGDQITATATLANVQLREGKHGKLLFMTVEITYTNQEREIVAKELNTVIRY